MSRHPGFILTKIVATLGPATADGSTIIRMIEEGVRVFRINFSHGSFDQFAQLLANVRAAAHATGVPVGVLGDLQGPKIRIGKVCPHGVDLQVGDTVVLQPETIVAQPAGPGGQIVFSTTAPQALVDLEVGHRVFVDDGAVRMLVMEAVRSGTEKRVTCVVTVGGRVTSSKGMNLPDSQLSLPAMTEHDRTCVRWAVEHGVDILALSFVRRAHDVRELKTALLTDGDEPLKAGPPPIIAKIEKPQALDELDTIIQEADGVMVARGDLGVEMDLASVPVIQKRIIARTHHYGKPVIVATQMLQSMIDEPNPTRAEVSDVANAIYDGADAVMLSGETAVGKYPLQAVNMMARVASRTMQQMIKDSPVAIPPAKQVGEGRYRTAALARGVATVVGDLQAKMVVIWSNLGGGARYLSKNRLLVPIVAASCDPAVVRRMNLLFGVIPISMPMPVSREAFASEIDVLIQQCGWAKPGDPIVLVASDLLKVSGVTDSLWIRYVGDV